MYATAHRVLSTRNGREGINAFLHVHGRDFPWPQDASSLPEVNPGKLEDEVISIKPGGNSVRSYLDILAPDTTTLKDLLSALENLAKSITTLDNPFITHNSTITIRFGVESALENERAEQLQTLTAAIQPLLEAWSAKTTESTQMSNTHERPPRVFISYSWSTPTHRQRVKDLADRLISDRIDAIIDIYDLREGQDINAFMEKMVTDPDVTKVLIICDKIYTEKANNRKGGVGAESQIISSELYGKVDQQKFAAVVFEHEEGQACLPVFLRSRVHIDMSTPEGEAKNYEQLVRWIYNKPMYKKPTIGNTPLYLLEEEQPESKTKHQFRATKDVVLQGRPYTKPMIQRYLNQYEEALEEFRITDPQNIEDKVVSSIHNFLRQRDEFVDFLEFIIDHTNVIDTWREVFEFFEKASRHLQRPPGLNSWNDLWFDNYRFILRELLVYVVATLISKKQYAIANAFLSEEYHVTTQSGGLEFRDFCHFSEPIKTLDDMRAQRLGRVSVVADLMKERATLKTLPFEELKQAEYIMFLHSLLHKQSWLWVPYSLVYEPYGSTLRLFAKAESKRYFGDLKTLLGVANKEELIKKYQEGDARHELRGAIRLRGFTHINVLAPGNFEKLDSRP